MPALSHVHVFCPRDVQKPEERVTMQSKNRVCTQQSKGRRPRKLARNRFQRSLDIGREKEGGAGKLQRTLSRVVKKIDLDQINLGKNPSFAD